jgi:hypothetical protein
MKDFKKLLEEQVKYLSEKNLIYRKQYESSFEALLQTSLIIIIE